LKKVCVNIWEPKLQWHFLPKPTDTKQKAHCSWLNPHYAHDFDSNLGACPGSECGPQIDLFKMSRAQFRCRALSGDLEQSRNFRDISEKVETETTQHADFFFTLVSRPLALFDGADFTIHKHRTPKKNTWTYPTNIVFLQFLPVFLP